MMPENAVCVACANVTRRRGERLNANVRRAFMSIGVIRSSSPPRSRSGGFAAS
jgi:hypothetical protein